MEIFNNTMYTVGHKVFKCLVIEKQDVHNAIEAAGLTVLEVYDDESFSVGSLALYTGTAVFHAQKNA